VRNACCHNTLARPQTSDRRKRSAILGPVSHQVLHGRKEYAITLCSIGRDVRSKFHPNSIQIPSPLSLPQNRGLKPDGSRCRLELQAALDVMWPAPFALAPLPSGARVVRSREIEGPFFGNSNRTLFRTPHSHRCCQAPKQSKGAVSHFLYHHPICFTFAPVVLQDHVVVVQKSSNTAILRPQPNERPASDHCQRG